MTTKLNVIYGLVCAILALPAAAQGVRVEAEAGVASLLALAQRELARGAPAAAVGGVLVNSAKNALGKLCRGEIDIAGTARPVAPPERDECARHKQEIVEFPLATDAVAVVVNPANTWAKQINLAELTRVWLESPGKAASWKQVNQSWPELPLKLYGPGPDLGLATNVRTLLNASRALPVPEMRRDFSATEVLSVIVEGVARDRAGLGLLDWATYSANAKRVRLVPVEVEGVAQRSNQGTPRGQGALAYGLYAYVSAKSLKNPAARAYLDHVFANAERLTAQAGLGALDAGDYRNARQRLGIAQ